MNLTDKYPLFRELLPSEMREAIDSLNDEKKNSWFVKGYTADFCNCSGIIPGWTNNTGPR